MVQHEINDGCWVVWIFQGILLGVAGGGVFFLFMGMILDKSEE